MTFDLDVIRKRWDVPSIGADGDHGFAQAWAGIRALLVAIDTETLPIPPLKEEWLKSIGGVMTAVDDLLQNAHKSGDYAGLIEVDEEWVLALGAAVAAKDRAAQVLSDDIFAKRDQRRDKEDVK